MHNFVVLAGNRRYFACSHHIQVHSAPPCFALGSGKSEGKLFVCERGIILTETQYENSLLVNVVLYLMKHSKYASHRVQRKINLYCS